MLSKNGTENSEWGRTMYAEAEKGLEGEIITYQNQYITEINNG